jgi:hypothetical protein
MNTSRLEGYGPGGVLGNDPLGGSLIRFAASAFDWGRRQLLWRFGKTKDRIEDVGYLVLLSVKYIGHKVPAFGFDVFLVDVSVLVSRFSFFEALEHIGDLVQG